MSKNISAFPVVPDASHGMELRDYFAAFWIINSNSTYSISDPKQLAKNAYAFADAMMEVRSEK